MKEYFFKDANRDWWKLTLEKGREAAESEFDDYYWNYTLEEAGNDTMWHPVIKGEVLGQYDTEPTVDYVMQEIARRFVSLTIQISVESALQQKHKS